MLWICEAFDVVDIAVKEGSIVTATYPTVNPAFEDLAAHTGVESLKDLIRAVRNARAEVNVAPSKPITILVKTSDSDLEAFFNSKCQLHQTLHKSRTLGNRINHPCT